jgi:hypothetical protein
MRGTMLWFNPDKELGALRTEGGDRLEFAGQAFAPGERPVGRCAGLPVEFELLYGAVSGIAFVPEPAQRRARMRRGR